MFFFLSRISADKMNILHNDVSNSVTSRFPPFVSADAVVSYVTSGSGEQLVMVFSDNMVATFRFCDTDNPNSMCFEVSFLHSNSSATEKLGFTNVTFLPPFSSLTVPSIRARDFDLYNRAAKCTGKSSLNRTDSKKKKRFDSLSRVTRTKESIRSSEFERHSCQRNHQLTTRIRLHCVLVAELQL